MPETASSRVGGQTVPVVSILCLVVFARIRFNRWRGSTALPRGGLDAFVRLFSGAAVLAAAYGLLRFHNPITLLYAAQTIAPLSAYVVARHLVLDDADVQTAWRGIVFGAAGFAAVLLGNELLKRPIWDLFAQPIHGTVGALNIYQANDYLPFLWAIVAVTSGPLLFDRRTSGVLLASSLVLLGVCVGALYARGALLLLIMGTLLGAVGSSDLWRTKRRAAAVFGCGVIVAAAFISSPAGVRLRDRGQALLNGERLATVVGNEGSLRDRLFSMRVVADYVGAHPLFGSGLTPVSHRDLSPRIASLSARQIFPAHNQYLDVALRGGQVLLLAFLLLLGAAMQRAWMACRLTRNDFSLPLARGIVIALFMTIALGNMYEQNHVQPLTAFFLWFLAGMVETMVARAGSPA
jgi:hypothetical protein